MSVAAASGTGNRNCLRCQRLEMIGGIDGGMIGSADVGDRCVEAGATGGSSEGGDGDGSGATGLLSATGTTGSVAGTTGVAGVAFPLRGSGVVSWRRGAIADDAGTVGALTGECGLAGWRNST